MVLGYHREEKSSVILLPKFTNSSQNN